MALGYTGGGGYVTPADLIFWTKDNDVWLEFSGAVQHKEHIFTAYYPLYYTKPQDVKYFVFHADGHLLAVKNPYYKGE